MIRNVSDDSVFSLITSLCEKFDTHPAKIKTLRSKCFEYLLGKKEPVYKKNFRDVRGTDDPYIKLLAWNFELKHDFNREDLANRLQKSVDGLKERYTEDTATFNNILQFLLNLRSIPPSDDDKFDLAFLPDIDHLLTNVMSDMSMNLMDENGTYSVDLRPEQKLSRNSCAASKTSFMLDFPVDEGYVSPVKDDIWEFAVKMECPKRRTWESFGRLPDKEKPFLSELGELSSLWEENLYSLYLDRRKPSKLKPQKVFVSELKYMLVGISSDSFKYDENNNFRFAEGITIEGVAPDTLEVFCKDLMFCGTCYKALESLSVPDMYTRAYKHPGYIFKEFCMSINQYLQFYRVHVFNISNSTNIMAFYEKTKQMRVHIQSLASLCKVGPYSSEDIPHGMALLNYLYQKVLNTIDDSVLMVFYSILYPCCQVYFRFFLQQWILEGFVNDQYGEFFIGSNGKYNHSRGRTYWTRSYFVCEDIVPDFLIDLKDDILFCGKIMNLLKLCCPTSKLNLYLRDRKPVFFCCFNQDQMQSLRQSIASCYLEASAECSPKFSLSKIIDASYEEDPVFMEHIAKKRAATLRRLELERQKLMQEQKERKLEELSMLKEQYDLVLEQKQIRILKEIEREMKTIEESISLEVQREKLIQDESQKMIDHYTKLSEVAEIRKSKVDQHVKILSDIHLEHKLLEREQFKSAETVTSVANESSSESFYSVVEDEDKNSQMHTSESLDVLNANAPSLNEEKTKNESDENIQQAITNFEAARRNKHRVLTQEMGFDLTEVTPKVPKIKNPLTNLTEAQRNKLKVMSSEFGITFVPEPSNVERILTAAQINRNRVLGTNECLNLKKLDNENFLNKNPPDIRKSQSLSLDFSKTAPEKPIPMSVDSTPMSEPVSDLPPTPSTSFLSIDTAPLSSVPQTADTHSNEAGFDFEKPLVPIYINKKARENERAAEKKSFSKVVTLEEALGVSRGCMKFFLKESVVVPLMTQMELAKTELLKFFVLELKYLEHLHSLRRYFFLQDGEFARNMTENLFAKLYDTSSPIDLVNCRTLHHLVFDALDFSAKNEEYSQLLSFKVNSLPKCFDLGDPDVLDCLSLTYRVQWPLNIVLPSDTISRYNQVFKYLLKLSRISWVMKVIFLELKILAKEVGKKEIYLMASPQYSSLHRYRHIMTHFIQTLQNYIIAEVLRPSWDNFEKNLRNVKDLDELYAAHTSYIKSILFKCLLNQKTAALRSVIQKIFVVILKFYDYLRSARWKCEDGTYVHPNFHKLERIFANFEEFVFYLFKVGRKVCKSGYQPHLIQLLDALNINGYYDQKVV